MSRIFPPLMHDISVFSILSASMSRMTELPTTRSLRLSGACMHCCLEASSEMRLWRPIIVEFWVAMVSSSLSLVSISVCNDVDKSTTDWDILVTCSGTTRHLSHIYTSAEIHFLWYGLRLHKHFTIPRRASVHVQSAMHISGTEFVELGAAGDWCEGVGGTFWDRVLSSDNTWEEVWLGNRSWLSCH